MFYSFDPKNYRMIPVKAPSDKYPLDELYLDEVSANDGLDMEIRLSVKYSMTQSKPWIWFGEWCNMNSYTIREAEEYFNCHIDRFGAMN